jgi:hypothetical protein
MGWYVRQEYISSDTSGATRGEGTAKTSGAHEFTSGFKWGRRPSDWGTQR